MLHLNQCRTELLAAILENLLHVTDVHALRTQLGHGLLQLLNAQYFASFIWDTDTGQFAQPIQINMDPDNIQKYASYYQFCNPLTPLIQRKTFPVKVSDILPTKTLRKTEFFNDFLRKDGLHWGLNLYIWHNNKNLGDIRIWRDERVDDFTQGDIQLLRLLQPGLTYALQRVTEVPKPKLTLISNSFSAREAEVVRLVGQGLSNKEIARQLGISCTTVHTYLQRAFEKTGVHRRAALPGKM
jgi:hypothetical protein